jgi:hypothetical protein
VSLSTYATAFSNTELKGEFNLYIKKALAVRKSLLTAFGLKMQWHLLWDNTPPALLFNG